MSRTIRHPWVLGAYVLIFQALTICTSATGQTQPGPGQGGQYYPPNPYYPSTKPGTQARAAATQPGTGTAAGTTRGGSPARPGYGASPGYAAPAKSAAKPGAQRSDPASSAARPAESPSPQQALKLTPVQKDVDYSRPGEEEIAKCKVVAFNQNGQSGWIVEDPQGLILRKFVDINGDNRIDQWCYYKDGLEVYRDIDSDFNGRVDQYRWFHTGGSRWALDRDEDGAIDAWKEISAEEASAEVVAALAQQDADRFARVLLTPAEVQSLGLGGAKTKELLEKVTAAGEKFKQLAGKSKTITDQTKWVQFGGNQPGVVPAGTNGSVRDVAVYENVLAMVQTGERARPGPDRHAGEGRRGVEGDRRAAADRRRSDRSGGLGLLLPRPPKPAPASGRQRAEREDARAARRAGETGRRGRPGDLARTAGRLERQAGRPAGADGRRVGQARGPGHVAEAVGRHAQRGRAVRGFSGRGQAAGVALGERPAERAGQAPGRVREVPPPDGRVRLGHAGQGGRFRQDPDRMAQEARTVRGRLSEDPGLR